MCSAIYQLPFIRCAVKCEGLLINSQFFTSFVQDLRGYVLLVPGNINAALLIFDPVDLFICRSYDCVRGGNLLLNMDINYVNIGIVECNLNFRCTYYHSFIIHHNFQQKLFKLTLHEPHLELTYKKKIELKIMCV